MVSLRSSLSLVEIMYSNSLGGIQSHETGPKRRPQRPPFGNPPTHHNTRTARTNKYIPGLHDSAGGRVGCERNPAPTNTAPLRRRRQSTRLNCAASPSYSGPDIVRFGSLSCETRVSLWLSIPPRNSSLSLGGARSALAPPLSDADPDPRLGPPSLRPLSRRGAPVVLRDGVPALITQSG